MSWKSLTALVVFGGLGCASDHRVGEQTGALCPLTPNLTAGDYKDIWGQASDDLWAVGERGGPQHWDGQKWAAPAAASGLDLSALWGASGLDLWAVGSGTLHWDGSRWSQDSELWPYLYDVAGDGQGELWAVGVQGTVLRRGASGWSVQQAPTKADLFAVWVFGPNEVWVAGTGGALLRWKEGAWSAQSPQGSSGKGANFAALWGKDPGELWVADEAGGLRRWDGTRWSLSHQEPTGEPAYYALWGRSAAGGPPSVWAGGVGKAMRWDGGRWDEVPIEGTGTGIGTTLLGISGQGDQVWAAGHDGTAFVRCFP